MCQCEACAAGKALNRGLASLAVRSLLSLSPLSLLSKFSSLSWDGDKHKLGALDLCWHSRSFEASLSFQTTFFFFFLLLLLPCPFEMRIHVKMHTHCLNLRDGGGGLSVSPPLSCRSLATFWWLEDGDLSFALRSLSAFLALWQISNQTCLWDSNLIKWKRFCFGYVPATLWSIWS